METSVNQRLSESEQRLFKLQKIETMISSLENDAKILKEKEPEARKQLEQEKEDYSKLTIRSITQIFYSVLGGLQEKTEKEQKEFLAAQLKYKQIITDLAGVETEIAELQEEKLKYKNAQAEYETLYNEKLAALIQGNTLLAQKIINLERQIDISKSNVREIDEAAAVGGKVLHSLDKVLHSLDKAKGWGTWDLIGGGLVSGLAKHSHVDAAADEIQNAQTLLRSLRTELVDVRMPEEPTIDIGGFAKFADFVFDGLIADWFIQGEIKDTIYAIESVETQVEELMMKLEEYKKADLSGQLRLKEQIQGLVVEA